MEGRRTKKIKIKTVGFHPTPRKLLKKFDQNFNQNRAIARFYIKVFG